MSRLPGPSPTARIRSRGTRLAWILALATAIPGCKPAAKSTATGSPPPAAETAPDTSALLGQLADARVDAAKSKLDQKYPDEALALLVSALKADPGSEEARAMAVKILAETVWNLPVLSIDHHLPIDQIAFAAPSTLWVSLGGTANTTVRWDLRTLQIGKVLFPADDAPTRALIAGPGGRSLVVERGPVTLLCDGETLKPVREIGALPDFLTPDAVLAFSPDGLLLANPAYVSETDKSLVWHLRDAATGEIIRSSDPVAADAPRPLAAHLDRAKLRVLHADGSLMEMPVSPVEPIKVTPMPDRIDLLGAQFSLDGNAALTLHSQGPHEAPAQSIVAYSDDDDRSLEAAALMKRFPWSRQPNLWNGLMNAPANALFTVDGNRLQLASPPHAPVVADAAITALAFEGSQAITGTADGRLTVHRFLPLPRIEENPKPAAQPDAASLAALAGLCESLSGIRYEEKERTFLRLDADERFRIFAGCDVDRVEALCPSLDFSATIHEMKSMPRRSAPADALLPLWDRLANADLSGASWPALLEKSKDLAATRWHQALAAAVVARAEPAPAGEDSPWLAARRMKRIFEAGPPETMLGAIQAAGDQGPAAANALAITLQTGHADWIEAILGQARDLPPVLRQIALSRIAWIQGRKAAALSPWPEDFPTMAAIRRREDWEGWEQADFEPALEAIRQNVREELAAIELAEDATPERRKAVAEKLENPETLKTVGKARYALACMKAALVLSGHPENAQAALKFATSARSLGAPAEPSLRAEAQALTATGDFRLAHERWVELITEHPLETQLPGDYAEAAYTAFENADPAQAMIILTTGMHRYPADANFALRAGWVALLTANPERAYDFLKIGKRTGYPAEKLENATALLVIAAAQAGSYDDATVYFNDLRKIDEAWNDPTTLDTLDWPDELKSVLRQFMQ